jgi:hypothetical protein
LQKPEHDDKEAWKAYWKAQGLPWRREPEIDTVAMWKMGMSRAGLRRIDVRCLTFGIPGLVEEAETG